MERRSDKHAPEAVIEQLVRLPGGQVFENVQTVWQTLGGHADRRF